MATKTRSAHRSAFLQATHQLDILGYSTIKSLGVATSVRSGTFHAGGFPWALVCRFDVETTESDAAHLASISLELSRNETDHDVVAMASLRIEEAAGTGQLPAAVWQSGRAHNFRARARSAVAWDLSIPDAFRRNEARYVDADTDRLTIHCTVDVLQEDFAAATAVSGCFVSLPPPPSISLDFHKLLRGRCRPDVTFVVNKDTEIPAHKLVLAMRSSVFRAQFFHGDMKEGSAVRIEIHDMSAATLRAMLYFIYTDKQPSAKRGACPVSMAQDLLVAADLYDLERLRLMCEKILSENMDVDNAMTTLMAVHGRHSCQQLEASCIEFLASNPDVYQAIEDTEEYKELEKDCAAFMNEVNKQVARRALARNSTSSSSCSMNLIQPHKSVSRYNPCAWVRGRHDFVIESLSAVRERRRAQEYIRSGTFQVGVYEWAIDVYPWVKGEDGEEHVGIYLTLLNAPTTANSISVKTSACFRINDPSPAFSHGDGDLFDVYTKVGQSYGIPHFITLESATSDCERHGGSLTVHIEVQVATVSLASTAGANLGPVIAVPPTDLAWHLEQLLAAERGWDVKFLVQETEIRAHSLVIAARSHILHKAVESATSAEHVSIDGMDATAFKAMLHFIYTDELPCCIEDPILSVAEGLLAAACQFCLERMKRLCINLLAEKVTTVSAALATLTVAQRHNCPDLEEYCKRYMSLPHVASKVRETCIRLFLESQLAQL